MWDSGARLCDSVMQIRLVHLINSFKKHILSVNYLRDPIIDVGDLRMNDRTFSEFMVWVYVGDRRSLGGVQASYGNLCNDFYFPLLEFIVEYRRLVEEVSREADCE